jgi:RecT family
MPTTKRRTQKTRRVVRRKPSVQIVRAAPRAIEKPWELSVEQITILKNSIAKGASDDELKFCLEVARRYRLDPFKGQIWFIPRWDKNAENGNGSKGRNVWVPQVSIYGKLHIAARDHADYGSLSLPEYGPMITLDVEGHKLQGPEWARVKVWKKGLSEPTVGEAYFEEYCPKRWENTLFWRTMARRMIAKCAKSQGVSEAYPDLGGLTIPEETERLNEDFTESGREIVVASKRGSAEAAQEVGRRRVEELKAKIEARKQETPAVCGTIEIDWSKDEASPILRGDIESLLARVPYGGTLHITQDRNYEWHCEPRDAEMLKVRCLEFGYECKEILPVKFPAAASKTSPGGGEDKSTGVSEHKPAPVDSPKPQTQAELPLKEPAASVQEPATARSKPERRETANRPASKPKPLPRAQIPFVVKAVKPTPSGKGLEVTLDTGVKLYAFDNRKMGEDGEKLLDLLVKEATGKTCIFVTDKKRTKDNREFLNIKTALQIGEREWDEDGIPILRRDPCMREPGED